MGMRILSRNPRVSRTRTPKLMNTRPLPHDIISRFGHLPDHQFRGNGEHSSACPQCGGARGGRDLSDRFRFWERPGTSCNFWCRRCGFQGFTDDNKPGKRLTEAEILELETIRQREAQREAARLQAKIDHLRHEAYWQGYHDGMTDKHRAMWRAAGIPDSLQDYWQLGHTIYQSADFSSPALTIPYFTTNWQATTIQYRLTNPPAPNDKYRFQAGLRAGLWLANPDQDMSGDVLICEGMKKAAVTWINLYPSAGFDMAIVAAPSKSPGKDMLDILSKSRSVYIAFDPDAYMGKSPAVNRLVKMLPMGKRIIKLPCKADDFFTLHGGTADDFLAFIRQAVTV